MLSNLALSYIFPVIESLIRLSRTQPYLYISSPSVCLPPLDMFPVNVIKKLSYNPNIINRWVYLCANKVYLTEKQYPDVEDGSRLCLPDTLVKTLGILQNNTTLSCSLTLKIFIANKKRLVDSSGIDTS